MSAPLAPESAVPADEGEERHASWLELFFDLVVVAGIGALAHLLHRDTTAHGLATYLVCFTAFWLVWACFTTYANVSAERTRTMTMLAGMASLAVMVAAVPGIAEHATAFAVAYVVGRLVASRPWRRGTVVVDLPVVQAGFGVLPWIVSWWFDGGVQLALWAAGLVIDLVVLVVSTRERLVASGEARLDRVRDHLEQQEAERERRAAPGRRGGRRRDEDRVAARDLRVTIAGADAPHLAERLSLFMLIVLGESLIQAIDGASEAVWGRPLAVTGAGAFALVVGLWGLSVRRGHAGVALLDADGLSPRLSWAAHLVTTCAVAMLAAVVANLTADPLDVVADRDRAILVAATVVYALVAVVVHGVRRDWRRVVAVGVPFAVAALLVASRPAAAAESTVWLVAGGALVAGVLGARGRPRAGGPGRAPNGAAPPAA